MSRVTLIGEERLLAVLSRLENAEQALGRALYEEANRIFNESQLLVPVDTGTLRSSGQVTLPEQGPRGVSVTIGYGGAAAPYAIYVHERLDLNHPNGGQAKYLEEPVMAAADGIADRLADTLDALAKGAA